MARKEYSDIAVETALTGTLNIGGLSFTVDSATGWPAGTYDFIAKIEDELILCSARSGTTITVDTRGFAGTTEVQHQTGAVVEHVWDAHSATDFARHVYDTSADDHTQYQKESEKDQNNGYAGLDGSGLVPDARIASTIARDSEVTSAVSTHAGAVDPHGDRAYADSLATDYEAAGAVATHSADTTSVHGIADTSALVLTGDSRLSDTRTPTDGSVTQAKVASGYGLTYSGTSAPSSPTEGDVWYDSDDDVLYVYDGSAWQAQGVGALISYTPTVRQNGSSKTKTVNYCKYTYGNHHATMWFDLTVTQAGTGGTPIDISLPIPSAAGAGIELGLGGARHLRVLGFSYIAMCFVDTASASRAYLDFSTLIASQALANGDLLHGIFNWPI